MEKAIVNESESRPEVRVPPPVPDGTQYVESLGFIDRLVGADRDRRRAEIELADLFMSEAEWEANGGDPEPVEIPEPVEGGDDVGTRGG
ncbi:MAG: hypothetical protein GEU71_15775 [Actinobacteria bacterium]|nr:hypothetical protein [Actinomycetota bacterium]